MRWHSLLIHRSNKLVIWELILFENLENEFYSAVPFNAVMFFSFIGMENWKAEGWERWAGGSYDIFHHGTRGTWLGLNRNVRDTSQLSFSVFIHTLWLKALARIAAAGIHIVGGQLMKWGKFIGKWQKYYMYMEVPSFSHNTILRSASSLPWSQWFHGWHSVGSSKVQWGKVAESRKQRQAQQTKTFWALLQRKQFLTCLFCFLMLLVIYLLIQIHLSFWKFLI